MDRERQTGRHGEWTGKDRQIGRETQRMNRERQAGRQNRQGETERQRNMQIMFKTKQQHCSGVECQLAIQGETGG